MEKSNLTSVKIIEDLYKRFKQTTVNTKMTIQKLTNRSTYLYLMDEHYTNTTEKHDNLIASGNNV